MEVILACICKYKVISFNNTCYILDINRTHTCYHFNAYSQIQSPSNCLCTVMPGWVKERHKANKFPWTSWAFFLSLRDFLFEKKLVYRKTHCSIFSVINILFKPGKLLQVIANHAQQIYLSQDEPYARFLIYYVQDLESENCKTCDNWLVTDDY